MKNEYPCGYMMSRVYETILCVLYFDRGRCAELISYWQFITADKNSMAQAYFTATRKMEEGEANSLSSLFVALNCTYVKQ